MHFHGIVVSNPVNYRKFPFHLCRQPVDTTAVPKIKTQSIMKPYAISVPNAIISSLVVVKVPHIGCYYELHQACR